MKSSSAAGVVRLTLLALAATGFLAMHGIAATDPVAGHVSPLDAHSVVAADGPSDGKHDSEPAASTMAPAPACDDACHDDMAACAFILLTVLAGVVLHALGIGAGSTWTNLSTVVWSRRGPARAPPQPIFLSLCVFRL
jgi:hypothetical protein